MGRNNFAGSAALTRFIFRRDRLTLFLWLVGLTGFAAAMVPVFESLFTNDMERMVMARMMHNPAMIALVGPVYGTEDYHTGAAFSNMMLLFSAMAAGVMNIFLVIKHTRQDEELGRMEVIRSLPVGRLANLGASLMAAVIVNAVLSLVTGLGLYLLRGDGMSLTGCLLFGVSMGVTGMFFAAAAAFLAQTAASNRTVTSLAFLLLTGLYILRAAGDTGKEGLALASPLGLILRTETFVRNHWGPVWMILALTAVITALAFLVAGLRDLGQGIVPARPGRRHGTALLSTPLGLAVRLLRTSAIVWMGTIYILAAMYGSIFGELDAFIEGNIMLQAMFSMNAGHSPVEQFIALLVVVMAMIATIPLLSFMHRLHGEEKQGHIEHLYGRAVSRREQFLAYLLPAIGMSLILSFLTALGFWSMGSLVLETIPSFGIFVKAAFAYVPSMWVFLGISAFLTAYLPGKLSLSYIYLGYSMVSVYIGAVAGLPEWTKKLTPFGYVSQVPVEEFKVLPLICLTLLAVVLGIVGYVGYGKRDMQTG